MNAITITKKFSTESRLTVLDTLQAQYAEQRAAWENSDSEHNFPTFGEFAFAVYADRCERVGVERAGSFAEWMLFDMTAAQNAL